MTYPISPESRQLLDELDHLRSAARALLDLASRDASDEWTKFERRFPTGPELLQGAISLSRTELEEMRSKARRFRDILEAIRCGSHGALRRSA
jgi:hypothetical protein